MRFIAIALVAGLAGCAGTPIGDALTGKEKLAEQDDAYCRSIGGVPGTTPYMQCRMFRADQRQRSHQAAFSRASASMAATSASYSQQAASRPINCRSVYAADGAVRTNCY